MTAMSYRYGLSVPRRPAARSSRTTPPSRPLRCARYPGIGRGDDCDADFFRAVTTGEPQLWRLEADGTAIKDLDWVQLDGAPLAAGDVSADETHAVLRDLALDPGRHWFSIRSTGGDYALRLIPRVHPTRMASGNPTATPPVPRRSPWTQPDGRLVMGRDVDVYRFSLAAREHVSSSSYHRQTAPPRWSSERWHQSCLDHGPGGRRARRPRPVARRG